MYYDCNLSTAHIVGDYSSVNLLYQGLKYLKVYPNEKHLSKKYADCLLCLIDNYKALLKEKGLNEKDVWVEYYGYNCSTLDDVKGRKKNPATISVVFGYKNEDKGKSFWQLICDILGVKVEVVHQTVYPKYNYVVERQEDLSERYKLIHDGSFKIMRHFACYKIVRNNDMLLKVRDVDNPKSWAEFTWNSEELRFEVWKSTFRENKSKYEMLYLVERNRMDIFFAMKREDTEVKIENV